MSDARLRELEQAWEFGDSAAGARYLAELMRTGQLGHGSWLQLHRLNPGGTRRMRTPRRHDSKDPKLRAWWCLILTESQNPGDPYARIGPAWLPPYRAGASQADLEDAWRIVTEVACGIQRSTFTLSFADQDELLTWLAGSDAKPAVLARWSKPREVAEAFMWLRKAKQELRSAKATLGAAGNMVRHQEENWAAIPKGGPSVGWHAVRDALAAANERRERAHDTVKLCEAVLAEAEQDALPWLARRASAPTP